MLSYLANAMHNLREALASINYPKDRYPRCTLVFKDMRDKEYFKATFEQAVVSEPAYYNPNRERAPSDHLEVMGMVIDLDVEPPVEVVSYRVTLLAHLEEVAPGDHRRVPSSVAIVPEKEVSAKLRELLRSAPEAEQYLRVEKITQVPAWGKLV